MKSFVYRIVKKNRPTFLTFLSFPILITCTEVGPYRVYTGTVTRARPGEGIAFINI